jgi:hypothetical protein
LTTESSYSESTRHTDSPLSFVKISASDVDCLLLFLNEIGDSAKSFRYYSKRKIPSALDNHITTLLLVNNGSPVAYGHLDREGDNVWLGICVKDSEVGRGYGNMMMKQLTSSYYGDIVLSVDKSNHAAISLYHKYGFCITDSNDVTLFMRKSSDSNL